MQTYLSEATPVHVEGDDVTVDRGNTVVNLTVSGSNAALKNGTIINLPSAGAWRT